MVRITFHGIAVAPNGQQWFYAAPFSLDGLLLASHAVAIRLPLPPGHYVDSCAYSSLRHRYHVLDVRRAAVPSEIGWGDPLVQRLIVDLVERCVITPSLRSPRYLEPVAWSPSERYLLYRVVRNVPAWRSEAEGAYVERAEETIRLLDLQTNREQPLPKEIAGAAVAGFFAEQPDTLWALPHAATKGYSGLNAIFPLEPAHASKPSALTSTHRVYRIASRRLERMDAAQYRALQENWDYLKWQLGSEAIGQFAGSGFYTQVLAPLRDRLLASGAIPSRTGRLTATVVQVGDRALLLAVQSTPAPDHTGESFRPLLHHYLVERLRPETPRLVGVGAFSCETRLVEGAGSVWLVVAGHDERIFVLDGRQGSFEQGNQSDASLRVRGAAAQWRRADLLRQIRAWLQQQGIPTTEDGVRIWG